MATTQNAGHGPNGYAEVTTDPVRMIAPGGAIVELNRWAAAPEYGKDRVMGAGWKVKKDGTSGNQRVKPILALSSCPTEVRAGLAAAGYPTESEN